MPQDVVVGPHLQTLMIDQVYAVNVGHLAYIIAADVVASILFEIGS